jgi:hypothetical protein
LRATQSIERGDGKHRAHRRQAGEDLVFAPIDSRRVFDLMKMMAPVIPCITLP